MGVDLDPNRVGSLRVGERQVVEIARSLSDPARMLILDEPTAALSHHEAEVLFGFIRRLRDQGVAIIYITHRLDEVTQIADRVQVLRDGTTSLLTAVASTDRRAMIEAMIGRRMAEVGRPAPLDGEVDPEPAIEWRQAGQGKSFHDVSLTAHGGEVVALFGKLGSGATRCGRIGIRRAPPGQRPASRPAAVSAYREPWQAIDAGIGFLPADRKAGGAFMVRPVAENVAVSSWGKLAHMACIRDKAEAGAYHRWKDDPAQIRSRNNPRQTMGTLSGGNQQKVLLARWLERESRALVLVEPTRGVDVGAREDIYRSLRELAATGVAILVVTSDYEEAVQVADRAYVMARGMIVANLEGTEITTDRLLTEAGG